MHSESVDCRTLFFELPLQLAAHSVICVVRVYTCVWVAQVNLQLTLATQTWQNYLLFFAKVLKWASNSMDSYKRVAWLLLTAVKVLGLRCHFLCRVHLLNLKILLNDYLLLVNWIPELVWIAHKAGWAVTAVSFNHASSCASSAASCMILPWGNSVSLNHTIQTHLLIRAGFKSW